MSFIGFPELIFGLQTSVTPNVEHGGPAIRQNPGNQQAPVAHGRILFATKDGRFSVQANAPLQSVHPAQEEIRPSDFGVQNMSILIVKLSTVRTSAQIVAQKTVSNAGGIEHALQPRLIILRRIL